MILVFLLVCWALYATFTGDPSLLEGIIKNLGILVLVFVILFIVTLPFMGHE